MKLEDIVWKIMVDDTRNYTNLRTARKKHIAEIKQWAVDILGEDFPSENIDNLESNYEAGFNQRGYEIQKRIEEQ